jgi:ABC-type Na+ transport system ATPase subunit NatA
MGSLGPNGSGKSTLFKLLSTIMPFAAGARLDARPRPGHAGRRDPEPHRGRLPVARRRQEKLTVRENLHYGGMLLGIAGRQLAMRIDQMLEATKPPRSFARPRRRTVGRHAAARRDRQVSARRARSRAARRSRRQHGGSIRRRGWTCGPCCAPSRGSRSCSRRI